MQMKGKIRKYIPILMWTALLLAAGCGAPPVPPSDEEMAQYFLAHEAAFETLREVIARCPYGMYYPPYDTRDTACLKGISVEDRLEKPNKFDPFGQKELTLLATI